MNKISFLRKELDMSQSQFANDFNIPVRTLQKWEQGASSPPIYVLQMIETILFLENTKKEKDSLSC